MKWGDKILKYRVTQETATTVIQKQKKIKQNDFIGSFPPRAFYELYGIGIRQL